MPKLAFVLPVNAQIYYDLCFYLATFKIIPADQIASKLKDIFEIDTAQDDDLADLRLL